MGVAGLRLCRGFSRPGRVGLDRVSDIPVAVAKDLSVSNSLRIARDRDVQSKLQVKPFAGVGLSLSLVRAIGKGKPW